MGESRNQKAFYCHPALNAINLIQDFQIDPNFVFIPKELVPDTPIITVWDNIDQLEETLMGAGTSHRCNGTGVQPKSAQPVDVKMIEPKSQRCRRSLPIGALDELKQYYTVQRQSSGHLTFLEVENCTIMLKHQSTQNLLWIFTRLVNPMQQIMPSWTGFFISVSRPSNLWKPKTLRSQKLTWKNLEIQAPNLEYFYQWETAGGKGVQSSPNILEDNSLLFYNNGQM